MKGIKELGSVWVTAGRELEGGVVRVIESHLGDGGLPFYTVQVLGCIGPERVIGWDNVKPMKVGPAYFRGAHRVRQY